MDMANGSTFSINGDRIMEALSRTTADGTNHLFRYQIQAVQAVKRNAEDGWEHGDRTPICLLSPVGAETSSILALLPFALKAKKVLFLSPSSTKSSALAAGFGHVKHVPSWLELSGVVNFPESDVWPSAMAEGLVVVDTLHSSGEKLKNLVIVTVTNFKEVSQETTKGSEIGGNQHSGEVDSSRIEMHLNDNWTDECIIQDAVKFFMIFDLVLVVDAQYYTAETWRTISKTFSEGHQRHFNAGINYPRYLIFVSTTAHTSADDSVQIIPDLRIAFKISKKASHRESTRSLIFKEEDMNSNYDEMPRVYSQLMSILQSHDMSEDRFQHQAVISMDSQYFAVILADYLNNEHTRAGNVGVRLAILIHGKGDGEFRMNQLTKFKNGNLRIAIVYNKIPSHYLNSKISAALILYSNRSMHLFDAVATQCMHKFLFHGAQEPDKTVATIFSFTRYQQRQFFQILGKLATEANFDF